MDPKSGAADQYDSNKSFLERQIKNIVVDDSKQIQALKAAR